MEESRLNPFSTFIEVKVVLSSQGSLKTKNKKKMLYPVEAILKLYHYHYFLYDKTSISAIKCYLLPREFLDIFKFPETFNFCSDKNRNLGVGKAASLIRFISASV